jgi:hypothetical protein
MDNGAFLIFSGNQTFPSGTIQFAASTSAGYLTIADNSTLTLGPSAVLRGKSGTVGGNGTLINQGLISADVAGGTIRIDVGKFIDNGTVEQKNGGKIVIVP